MEKYIGVILKGISFVTRKTRGLYAASHREFFILQKNMKSGVNLENSALHRSGGPVVSCGRMINPPKVP
jgi:hypothetical protein